MRSSANVDLLLAALAQSAGPVCDDCLSERTGISPRQQVNHICGSLSRRAAIGRLRGVCVHCGKYKLSNTVSPAPANVAFVQGSDNRTERGAEAPSQASEEPPNAIAPQLAPHATEATSGIVAAPADLLAPVARVRDLDLSDALLLHFHELLRLRLASHVPTTEDSVRYTFFAALLATGIAPEEVVLEYKHPSIPNALIDTVRLDNLRVATAIEFKYHRVANSTSPKPQKAGDLLHDISRLLQLPEPIGRYLVYVTDADMADYLAKPQHGLRDLFLLPVSHTIRVDAGYFAARCQTLVTRAGSWPATAAILCRHAAPLPQDHVLRVYGVLRAH